MTLLAFTCVLVLLFLSRLEAFLVSNPGYNASNSRKTTAQFALKTTQKEELMTRRKFLGIGVSLSVTSVLTSMVQASVAADLPADVSESISYDKFSELLLDEQITSAKFYGANGDVVVLTLKSGKLVTIGEGMYKESSFNPSSPLKVANKLRDFRVPYSFDFNLKGYSKPKQFANVATELAEQRAKVADTELAEALAK